MTGSIRRLWQPLCVRNSHIVDPVPGTQSRAPVSEEQIRERAYLNWEVAGLPSGDGLNFWLEAQQELRQIEAHLALQPLVRRY